MPSLLKIRGLNTFSNELEIPEGSLKTADNVIIDRDDVAVPRRGFADYGTALPCSVDRVSQTLEYKDRLLRHFDCTLQFDSNGTGTFSSFSGTFSPVQPCLRIKEKQLYVEY